MAINFIPYDELFAPSYQLTYISIDGHISVGPNIYSVFHNYTVQERQQIFQVCEKFLPWEGTQEQEHWERTMYMYQFIIKSPPPFPYSEYPLNEEIMPIAWYIVPWKREIGPEYEAMPGRYCAINDYSKEIFAAGGNWASVEVLGGRHIVKVQAPTNILSALDLQYKRLPKDRLDDSLSDLPSNVRIALKNELLDMGYSLEEIWAKLGNDIGQFTLRDVLKFAAQRRRKPRYDRQTDTILCDGDERPCSRSIESVDREIQ